MNPVSHKIHRLNLAISCPKSTSQRRFPLGARNLLYECWAAVLCEHLPDPSIVDLLIDWEHRPHGTIFVSQEDCVDASEFAQFGGDAHNTFDIELLLDEEIDGFIHALEESRFDFVDKKAPLTRIRIQEDFGTVKDRIQAAPSPKPLCGIWLDEKFDELSRALWQLRVVQGDEREKHWPPPHVKTGEQLLRHSLIKPGVGWLNPGTDAEELRIFALATLALYFFGELKQRADFSFVSERAPAFLDLWEELFQSGTFRLGVTHKSIVGAQDGLHCRDMVYDFDLQQMQFHCFPVSSFPIGTVEFIEDQLDL